MPVSTAGRERPRALATPSRQALRPSPPGPAAGSSMRASCGLDSPRSCCRAGPSAEVGDALRTTPPHRGQAERGVGFRARRRRFPVSCETPEPLPDKRLKKSRSRGAAAASLSVPLVELPLEILSRIFVLASNPRLAYVARTFHAISLSPAVRAQWLLHRYCTAKLAARRGCTYRFFNVAVLAVLELYRARELERTSRSGTQRALPGQLYEDGALLELPTTGQRVVRGQPQEATSPTVPGCAAAGQHPVPAGRISFDGSRIPCWPFANAVAGSLGFDSPDHHPLSLIIALLERGASPNNAGGYPLVKAASLGMVNTVRALLRAHADLAAFGGRTLVEAAKAGHLDVVQELLETGTGEPTSAALRAAVESNRWSVVDYLILRGAVPDINVVNAL
ncbi:MAG: hypothetical protein BJ554DRAFT_3874 [Olpidium bornovanus]|uniref:Uncharacterized protein n=1 Tax=Olpidium bornovanus TaxID=278681 RepID=A0A8H8DFC3_9FUNG|nr:MAG: hypothetical protein BJ554DRAFT_3874 [Olpidium bornovanus]